MAVMELREKSDPKTVRASRSGGAYVRVLPSTACDCSPVVCAAFCPLCSTRVSSVRWKQPRAGTLCPRATLTRGYGYVIARPNQVKGYRYSANCR